MSFLDPLIGVIGYGVEVTHLHVIVYGGKVPGALDSPAALVLMWPSSTP
jgi:hypothetical protein